MSKQEEQKKMKLLLTEAITQLCKGGLHFETKFTVEALIGITLDDNDVFLVNINESIQNDFSLDTSTYDSPNFANDKKSSTQISIKNENYDDENSYENREFEQDFSKNDQNINDGNYFDPNRQYHREGNEENYQERFSDSAIAENQIPENNMLHVKSENFDSGGGDEWMMNNNVELSENMSYSEQPSTHSFNSRGASYSLQAKRRARGRPSFRSLGQHRMRPQNNQNEFISPQQSTMQEGLVPLEVLNQLSSHQTILALKKKLSSPKNNSQQPMNINEGNVEDNIIADNNSLKIKSTKSSPQCWVCYRTFCSSQALKNHVDVKHLNKMAYKCNKCGECFKWRTGLCKHRRDLCPFRFQEQSTTYNDNMAHKIKKKKQCNDLDNFVDTTNTRETTNNVYDNDNMVNCNNSVKISSNEFNNDHQLSIKKELANENENNFYHIMPHEGTNESLNNNSKL